MGQEKTKRQFGERYSMFYDLIYSDKNYEKECDFLEDIFSKYCGRVRTLLDLGCGSGGHSIIMAKRGYQVTGVDISPYMIEVAQRKAGEFGVNPKFITGDIRNIVIGEKFDAVISMFAVVSYQTETESVISTFRTAYSHLKDEGIFVFDVWFGPAVLTQKPAVRVKEVELPDGEGKLIRIAQPEIDIIRNTVKVKYKLILIKRNEEKFEVEEFDEVHKVRFFFAEELKFFLKYVGFKNVYIFPFMDMTREPTVDDWNIVVIAAK